MVIEYTTGLERVARRVDSELSDVLGERERLGLSVTEPSRLFVRLYRMGGARAYAYLSDGGPVAGINLIPLAMDVIVDDQRDELASLMRFFDRAREVFTGWNEQHILSFIEDPSGAAQRFESSGTTEWFEGYRAFFDERGNGYEDLKARLVRDAEPIRDTLEGFLKCADDIADAVDLSPLRHEMDHVDFYTAPFYRSFRHTIVARSQAEGAWKADRNGANSRAYAQVAMDELALMAGVTPLLETRAMFFNHIPRDGWGDADYESIRNKVVAAFIDRYVEDNQVEGLLNPLVSKAWSEGRMDRETSNYVFSLVNRQRGNDEAAMRYVVKPEFVNYRSASRILHEELPVWKGVFSRNALDAAEVFADAYRDDPSRLKRAMIARTTEEYVALSRA